MSQPFNISGVVRLGEHGEGDNIVFIGDDGIPLAKRLADFDGQKVNVKVWVVNKEVINETGQMESEFGHAYSEETGYLWTNEEAKVGTVDLLDFLNDNIGATVEIMVTP